jgi:hypothetical protein
MSINRNKNSNKVKSIKTKVSNELNDKQSVCEVRDETDIEIKLRFELELKWAINELQIRINSSDKQQSLVHKDYEKALKVLKSTKSSVPKKRLIMDQIFGDYRNEMKQQLIKYSFNENKLKIQNCQQNHSIVNNKSLFIKKCFKNKTDFNVDKDSNFKFNF